MYMYTRKPEKLPAFITVNTVNETPKNQLSAGPKVFKTDGGHKAKSF